LQVPDEGTAERFRSLGADPARVAVTGSLKETPVPLPFDTGEAARLRAHFGDRPVWLAASTHPGEDEVLAEAHRQVRTALPGALLILAPRHPERGAALEESFRHQGRAVARREAGVSPGPETEIYIADTLGEMGLWYGLAPVSFVGGSLVPVGGHNPYEPVAQGSAVVSGPETGNFRDIYRRLQEACGARVAATPEAIAQGVLDLLQPEAAAGQAARARSVVAGGERATTSAVAAVLALLPAPRT
jgi:3-deoxy-D-manno-octulosonic-acid transferase